MKHIPSRCLHCNLTCNNPRQKTIKRQTSRNWDPNAQASIYRGFTPDLSRSYSKYCRKKPTLMMPLVDGDELGEEIFPFGGLYSGYGTSKYQPNHGN